ncbi:MAG: MarR family winged helix-turn-helix transcriptional regulator [Thermoleophilia bacterium]
MCKTAAVFTNVPNIEPLIGRVFAALHRTMRSHRQLVTQELAKKGSHPVEAFGLHVLLKNDGIAQRDLATRLYVSRPWVTKMLQSLEKSGAVVRRVDEQDQRLTRVFLTQQGRERASELSGVLSEYLAQTIGVLSDEEKLELERLLDKVNAGLAAELCRPCVDCAGAVCEPYSVEKSDAGEPSE